MALSLALIAGGGAFAYPEEATAASRPARQAPQLTAAGASALAAQTGEPVEVVAERTEYAQTMANPDGTYTLTQSTVPQRVRAQDGTWRNIDVTLEQRADGTVGPKAAAVDLSFSGGGSGKNLIRLASPRGAVELGWPGTLPQPRLEGATATYPEVYKGVDLQLTATAEGYREVLVVKSAEAAANPELDKVELTATGRGLTLAPGGGGGLRAVDQDGNTIFNGPSGLMWDSAGDDTGAQPQLLRAADASGTTEETTDPAAPAKGDATAELPVQVTDGQIAVQPDTKLLRGADTVYPVYIDPSLGLGVSERTVLSSDGDRFWNFTGDHGVGRCYRVGPYYCDADHTNRMYFEFSPTHLSGKYVIDATFRAFETWSFSCSPHWLDLWRTDNISESTRWPGPAQLDLMGDRNVSAGRSTDCTPEQPDSWIEFNDAASETDENLTTTVRNFADGKFSRLTLLLRAKDETNADAWKRFDDNAELKVVYVLKPGMVTDDGIIPGDGTMQGCSVSDATPEVATRLDPTLQARLQTGVQPASDLERGSLRARFHVQRKEGANWVDHGTYAMPSTGYYVDDSLARQRLVNGTDGTLYRVRSLTQSYWTYEGVTTAINSPYKRWCYFKIDLFGPKAPQVTSNGVYSLCADDALCDPAGGPYVAGSFRLRPNAVDTDISGYRWWLDTEPVGAHRVTGAQVDIAPLPTEAGLRILTVQAIDVRDRAGETTTFKFNVAPPDGPVGRWRLDDGTLDSSTSTVTFKDTATVGTRHDLTLKPVGTRAVWSATGRRGDNDRSLLLNNDLADTAARTGSATTNGAPLRTQDSFTVSAWAMLSDSGKTRIVASAPGSSTSAAFNLFYSASAKKWVFNRAVADSSTPAYVSAPADTANPPLNVWTHLAGVFDTKGDTDKANDTIQLFVNGRPQGSPVELGKNPAYTPWASTAGMTVGASKAGEYFLGRIDEVGVWQYALMPEQVRYDSELKVDGTPATELVAQWNAASTANGQVAQTTSYAARPLTLSPTGVTTNVDGTALDLDGVGGHLATTGPVTDETASFTVSAEVRLDKAKFTALPVGAKTYVFGQSTPDGKESSWALWVEKVSTSGYLWRFGRTATDATGNVIATSSTASLSSATLDTTVQVTGVYDAAEKTINGVGNTRLYVGDEEQVDPETAPLASFTTPLQGGGQVAAGRGIAAGVNGHFLPGSVIDLRVWSGAMTRQGVLQKVLRLAP
ncbi:hypothetical protein GCM10023237_45270 [Streptomyces coeruleoprunus]